MSVRDIVLFEFDSEGDPPLRARWSAFDQELDSRARLQAYSGFCSTTQRHDAGLHFWTTCRDLPGLPLSKRSSSSTSHDDTLPPHVGTSWVADGI
eukprot:s4639_g7.t1